MSSLDRTCSICSISEEMARLERCVACGKFYCADCAYRAAGRRFCSSVCARSFYYGETDDDENDTDTDGE